MRTRILCATIAALSLSSLARSQFATEVVDFQQGTGGGIFVQANILGGPQGGGLGGGSLHVLTLGEGGSVVLGFDVVMRDGPGADLAVFENGFVFGAGTSVFVEVSYVEVSTNGVDFARWPSHYDPATAGGTQMGSFANLGGGLPILANVNTDPDSPFDPVTSGGEPLDLADLAGEPAVVGGLVDLAEIHFVRLVDVVPGAVDSDGIVITGGASGGADIDAVAALHHDGEPAGAPVCDLSLDAAGFIEWRLGDPDGFSDLHPATLASSVSLKGFPVSTLFSVMTVVSFDGQVAVLRTLGPVTGLDLTATLAVSIRDDGGAISGDVVYLQD